MFCSYSSLKLFVATILPASTLSSRPSSSSSSLLLSNSGSGNTLIEPTDHVFTEYSGDYEHIDNEQASLATSYLSEKKTAGLLSSNTVTEVDTYKDMTGRNAGAVLLPDHNSDTERTNPSGVDNSNYYPFENVTDYALAQWLLNSECSRRDVDRFFSDKRMSLLHSNISFNSADQWLEKIHNIPYGIEDDQWEEVPFSINDDTFSNGNEKYTIIFRDPVKIIRYLLGHKPFETKLTYAPIHHYYYDNNRKVRIYSELHTAEWWWQIQQQLPDGATIVPLLIATDKTQLSQHHGDRSAWPVYLTIGNLNRATRRTQTSSALILMGHIPIISTNKSIKAEVYHTAMRTMLQSKYYPFY